MKIRDPYEVLMNQKPPSSPFKTTLGKVDPNRRQFLGLMLAGAAALPALTSTLLAAETNPSTDKNSTTIKTGSKIKNTANVQLKNADKTSNTQLKNADKTSNTQLKSAHKTANTQLKNSTALKHSGPQ